MKTSILFAILFLMNMAQATLPNIDDQDILTLPAGTEITFQFSPDRPMYLISNQDHTSLCDTKLDTLILLLHDRSPNRRVIDRPLSFQVTQDRIGYHGVPGLNNRSAGGVNFMEGDNATFSHRSINGVYFTNRYGSFDFFSIGELKASLSECGGELKLPTAVSAK